MLIAQLVMISAGFQRFSPTPARASLPPRNSVWLRSTPFLALLTFLAVAPVRAADEFHFPVDLILQRADPPTEGWTVVRIEGQTSVDRASVAAFESAGIRNKIRENLSRISAPCNLAELPARLENADPTRRWTVPDNFVPQAGRQRVLLLYRYPSTSFVIDLHVQGNDAAPLATTLPVGSSTGVSARHHATGVAGNPDFDDAVVDAAQQALDLAQAQGLVPGGTPGESKLIRERLQATFLLTGIDSDFSVDAPSPANRAIGLRLKPVSIPRDITVELTNWLALETEWDSASVAALRKKRLMVQDALREALVPVPRKQYTLVTAPILRQWTETPEAKKVELTVDRHEGDTLVLRAIQPSSRQDYLASAGLQYNATEGLLGSVSLGFVHEKATHLDLNGEINYGEDASSAKGLLRWYPAKTQPGWNPRLEVNAESKRNNRAHFGSAFDDESVSWKHWQTRIGVTAKRNVVPPGETGRSTAAFSLSASFVHTDDEFASTTPVPENPDSAFELKAAGTFSIPLNEKDRRLNLTALARFAQSLENFGGHYDGRTAEGQLVVSYRTPGHGRSWKIMAALRGGQIDGDTSLAGQFRAGGENGWIRGLREGELTGRAYWAQSFSAGPELSFLSGRKDSGRPPVYLLGFFDSGRVRESSGIWRSGQGYGVALNLDDLPLGNQGITGSLYLGYAYSPDSTADRHGSIFVRLDIPFEF